jgi:N-acetylglutamate synthase-like GNAT family acetyltransferase
LSEIILSDDKALLQVDRVHGWLATSYWSPGVDRGLVERAIAGSHCLGAYSEGEQVGFARMITDHATFAWLADVWVDEAVRGQGICGRMVQWFLDDPRFAGLRRMGLATRDAHDVYAKLGFHRPLQPEIYMERLAAGFAERFTKAS